MKLLIETSDVRAILCKHAQSLNAEHAYNKIELVPNGILLSYVPPASLPTPTRWQRFLGALGLRKEHAEWQPVDWSVKQRRPQPVELVHQIESRPMERYLDTSTGRPLTMLRPVGGNHE